VTPDDASEDDSSGYQGCQRSAGKDASSATKDVSQCREWADTSATRARMPAQGKRHQQDAGSGARGGKREASAIMAMTPVRVSNGVSAWRANIANGLKPAQLVL